MPSNDYVIQCGWCEKWIEPTRVPYGMAWLCTCGHWRTHFWIDGGMRELTNGHEHLAIYYIEMIVKKLKENKKCSNVNYVKN